MAQDAPRLTRITKGQRTLLQVASVLLLAVGGILFLSFFFALVGGMGGPTDGAGGFEDEASRMGSAFLRAVIGVVLLGIGAFLAKFAFLKPVSEIVATETSGAVQHASGAVGRGLASAGVGTGRSGEVVKVRCRGCGYLDTEDARFCSACGAGL